MTEVATTAEVVAAATARGAHPHVVEPGATADKRAALAGIARALSFPDWFGHNLDALYDCLTDLSWLPAGEHVLVWPDGHALRDHDPAGHTGVDSVLRDAARATATATRPLTVVFTED